MKKFYFFLALIMLSGATTFAQNVELSNKLIQRYETAKQKAVSKSAITHDHLWKTPLLVEAVRNWDDLTEEAKILFSKAKNRPTFTGTELTHDNGNFKFHYTTDGGAGEAVDATDTNPANGVPDYVDNMATKFVNDVYTNYHTTTGLTVPPGDGSEGGDALFDIYISGDIAGAGTYGYVAPETMIGDNPNSATITEVDAYTSYMVMRNNYAGFGDENKALSVTAAHEYMHGTQMGYAQSMDSWFMEICATWSEDYIYPGYDDNLQYLMSIFGSPDIALNLTNGEAGGNHDDHWYGSWIFAKYMTEHTGNEIIKNIYERCITQYAVNAIDTELSTNWSSSLDLIFLQFSIANAVMSDNVNFAPYTYSRASVYSNYVENNGGFNFENGSTPLNYTGTNISWNSQTDGNNRLMRLSADYFTLTSDLNFNISMNDNAETGIALIKMNVSPENISVVISDGKAEINVTDASSWDVFIPIVIRLDKNIDNTDPYNYVLSISDVTTGVENIKNHTNFYPNPANDFVNIISPEISLLNVSITDITGKVITTQELSENIKINVHNLKNGIYFLSVMKDNQIIKTEKLIISH